MSAERTCSQCGAPLPENAPGGRCPQCLVQLALEESGDGQEDIPAEAAQEPGAIAERTGMVIGRYKLLQQIGEGGFGIVFLAEQTEPVQRKVAIKVIKAGMDTREVIARFEAERQALALMDHPNIAQVLDAGATAGGRPYFVMELVRGIPITNYCDQANLSTHERLELFVKVCRAVQHAHQKGVIHRDLKPSNILITLHDGEPIPKVIDFGVAKALGQKLTEKTLFTRFEQMIGTPAYMSPEQAALSGRDMDTRSDIYSLGVLLYELLTGVTPLDAETLRRAALDEVRRMIRETEPPKPSTRIADLLAADVKRFSAAATEQDRASLRRLRQQKKQLTSVIGGDLDWITMKAMEKDRRRRYQTVNGLVADIERHLHDEPVLARSPSALYRVQKVARRHHVAFAACAVVTVALVLGVVISTLQALRATHAEREQSRQRDRADQEANRAKRAEQETREQLWRFYSDQARANRWSGRVGRRFDSLDLLKKAAEIRSSLELRNEAISCMALLDLRIARQWEVKPRGKVFMTFDASFERYARMDASQDTISVHRTRDDAELTRVSGFKLPYKDAKFSPNGQYLAVVFGRNPDLGVWDLARKKVIMPSGEFNFWVLDSWVIDFSADSRLLAVAQRKRGAIAIYDLASSKRLRAFSQGPLPWAIAFDPSGQRLAVSSDQDDKVQIRDVQTGEVIQSLRHPANVKQVSWHPSGNFLATACMDNNIYVWETATGKIRVTLHGHEGPVIKVAFDHEGDFVASSGGDGALRLWDVWSGRQLVNTPVIEAGVFSSDDRWLWAILDGQKVALWEVAKGRECRILHTQRESGKGPTGGDFSPDHRWFLSGHADGARLWDHNNLRELALFGENGCEAVAFHPDGKSFFTAGTTRGLEQWPIEFHQDGQSNIVRVGPPLSFGVLPKTNDLALSLSADGQTLALTDGRFIHVFDAKTRTERQRLQPQWRGFRFPSASGKWEAGHVANSGATAWNVALSPDGKFVAAASFSSFHVGVWFLQTGALEDSLSLNDNDQIAFSPDNRWLVAGSAVEYRFWKVDSWKRSHSIAHKGSRAQSGVLCFSADGKMLATAGSRNSIQLLEPEFGRELASLEAPFSMGVSRLRFNPDGSQLAAVWFGGHAIQIWDLRSIRLQLEAMNLDWDLPPLLPPGGTNEWNGPVTVTVLGSPHRPPAE